METLEKRGKPREIDYEKLKKLFSDNREVLVCNGKILPEKRFIWSTLSAEAGIKSSTLYSYAVSKRYDYRRILLEDEFNLSSSILSTSVNETSYSRQNEDISFSFAMKKSEFDSLLEERKMLCGRKKQRIRTKLANDLWEETIYMYIYNNLKLKHGFHFRNHDINRDGTEGTINGYCKCGSIIQLKLRSNGDGLNVFFDGTITASKEGECGKRQLRGIRRKEVGAEIHQEASVDVYVTKKRQEMQEHGDCEPAILHKAAVYRQAQTEYINSLYLHKDPIEALKIMKRKGTGRNTVRDIGSDPFYVFIFSPHQIRLWNLCRNEVPLIIDSTTGIARKLNIFPGEKSHTLALHLGVINCKYGQLAVFEGITERQDTVSIENLFKRFLQAGALYPKQTVSDSGSALLPAIVNAFTNFLTVEDYSDQFFDNPEKMDDVPFITIDVNHFVKDWAKFLSKEKMNKRVKVFYLASIGQLIISENLERAESILTKLLTIALSQTDGHLPNKRPTSAETCRSEIEKLITEDKDDFNDIMESYECDLSSSDENTSDADSDKEKFIEHPRKTSKNENLKRELPKNKWEEWALNLKKNIEKRIHNEDGDRVNAHANEKVAHRLIREARRIPMWSNVFKRKFQSTPIKTSTSASVECEIKKIKNGLLKKKGKYLRIDATADKLINYYDGKLRILGNLSNGNVIGNVKSSTNTNEDFQKTPIDITDVDLSEIRRPSYFDSNADENTAEQLKIPSCSTCLQSLTHGRALICVGCQKDIHSFEECSQSIDEEDGAKRICVGCLTDPDLNKKIALNEIENHFGLPLKDLKNSRKQSMPNFEKKRKNLYLGDSKEKIRDAILYNNNNSEVFKTLPILKNGNRSDLAFVRINQSKLSFLNTCPFDSVFQVLLCLLADNKEFLEFIKGKIEENEDDSSIIFLSMAIKVLEKGITANSYATRGKLMLDYLKKEKLSNIENIDCATMLCDIYNYLFMNQPSLTVTLECPNDGTRIFDQRISVIIKMDYLLNKQFFKKYILNGSHLHSRGNHCQTCQLMCFEPYSLKINKLSVKLVDLPKMVHGERKTDIYLLRAVVNFYGNEMQKENEIGHYTAICFREGSWYEFDGFMEKPQRRSEKTIVKPKAVFYLKQNT